jgi:hypothetical protein
MPILKIHIKTKLNSSHFIIIKISLQRLYAARNAIHQKKFNVELPWTYPNNA